MILLCYSRLDIHEYYHYHIIAPIKDLASDAPIIFVKNLVMQIFILCILKT